MFDKPQTIEQIDLERHMNDHASRQEMTSFAQKRFASMQNLLLKAQGLSDRDFETAFSALESVIDTFKQKNKSNQPQDKSHKTNLSKIIT